MSGSVYRRRTSPGILDDARGQNYASARSDASLFMAAFSSHRSDAHEAAEYRAAVLDRRVVCDHRQWDGVREQCLICGETKRDRFKAEPPPPPVPENYRDIILE